MKSVKVSIFPSNASRDNVITNNGIALDNICTSCTVEESIIDGNYTLNGTFLIDKETNLHSLIDNEKILKVNIDYGYEVFRIVQTRKTPQRVEVVARQITIAETINLWLEDVRPTNQNGQGCMSYLLANAIGVKDIFVQSDITSLNTSYFQNMSMYNALHSADNAFMVRWGGEIQRRAYTLKINQSIGVDRKVVIRSKKNLTGFESNIDLNKLVTRIKPQGYNGITANYVDSSLINNYSRVYTSIIKYDDVKVQSENDSEGFKTLAQAQAELIRLATLEYTQNHVDELRADYRINFINLEKTEEYKNYIQAERVYLGDTITVIEDTLGVELKVRALKRKYDILAERVIEVELSNTPLSEKKAPSINQILGQIKDDISGTNNSMADYIQSMINSGCTDSYVLYRQNEILLMDNKDINSATNVTRLNKNGLAFSQTGYYGTYSYGFTIDGKINADHIRTGTLTAILLQSVDGQNWINLQTGEVNFTKGKIVGKNALIDLNEGRIKSTTVDGKRDLSLYNGFLNFNNKIVIDMNPQFEGDTWGFGISDLEKNYGGGWYDFLKISQRWLAINHDKSIFIDVNPPDGGTLPSDASARMTVGDSAVSLRTDRVNITGSSINAYGNFAVTGNKNCVQKTTNYGNRLFYSVEDGQSFLTETGKDTFTVVKTESGTYERVILINQIYKECVNLEVPYVIDIHKEGWGDFRIKEKNKDYFILESDRVDFTFKYTIKAKRKGFEDENLKEYFMEELENKEVIK